MSAVKEDAERDIKKAGVYLIERAGYLAEVMETDLVGEDGLAIVVRVRHKAPPTVEVRTERIATMRYE